MNANIFFEIHETPLFGRNNLSCVSGYNFWVHMLIACSSCLCKLVCSTSFELVWSSYHLHLYVFASGTRFHLVFKHSIESLYFLNFIQFNFHTFHLTSMHFLKQWNPTLFMKHNIKLLFFTYMKTYAYTNMNTKRNRIMICQKMT